MKNPFAFLRSAEWYVLEALADKSYSDFGQCTKAFMTYLRGVNHSGPSTSNGSNAFKICKLLVEKGLIITNIGNNETYDDVVFITERGLKLVEYGNHVQEHLDKIMLIEPTQAQTD